MSKTKFLGIPEGGKRAGWIEMEGGSAGGGGAMVTKITMGSNGLESSIPYSEIRNAWVNNIPCFARFMVQDEASMMFWPQGLSFASEGETEDITFIGWNGNAFLAIKIDANDVVSTINIFLP